MNEFNITYWLHGVKLTEVLRFKDSVQCEYFIRQKHHREEISAIIIRERKG